MGLVTSPIGVIAAATAAFSLFLVIIDGIFRKSEKVQVLQANGVPLPTFQDLAEHAAAIVVAIGACTLLFNIWGVNLAGAERSMGARFFEEIVIILVAYFAYQATKIVIDRRLLAERRSRSPRHMRSFPTRPRHGSLHFFICFAASRWRRSW